MSNKNQATAVTQGTVRNWTDEEKDIVWQQVLQAKEENTPLTEAFRRVNRILPHRSDAAVGMLYYNVLRKEREEAPKKKRANSNSSESSPKFAVDTHLLEAFQGLPEYIQELNGRIASLEKRIENPDPMNIIGALAKLLESHSSQTDYKEQVKQLQTENTALQKSSEDLELELKKLKEAYEDALNIYDMFTNMASISQIMSLGDFKEQIKITLDKWGNVLDISSEE